MEVRVERPERSDAGVLIEEGNGRATHFPDNIVAHIEDAPWTVTLTIGMPGSVVKDVRLTMRPGGQPITPSMIRGVRLAEAVEKAIGLAGQPWEKHEDGFWYSRPGWTADAAIRAARSKPKRLTIDEEAFAAAEAYGRVVGRVPDVAMAVADELKRADPPISMSRTTAHRRIQRARELGYLEVGE
jgi:hypothetical protein